MPVIPLPAAAVVNVQFYGTLFGQRIINLFQYQANGPVTTTLDYFDYLDSLNDAIVGVGALRDTFLLACPTNYTLDLLRYQPVFPQRLRFKDYTQTLPGTAPAGPASTANVAASIERFSRTGRRHGIGRVQLVAARDTYDNGEIKPGGSQTILFNLGGAMEATISAVAPVMSWRPVICNTTATNPTVNPVEGTQFKVTLRTMHRRTVGLGI